MLKNKIIYFLIFLFAIAGFSCTDEKLVKDNTLSPEEEEGYYLATTLSLPAMTRAGTSTAAFEDLEDYIDPQQLNLLFFYADNEKANNEDTDFSGYNTLIKQFNASDLYIIPIASPLDGSLKNWYVRIPVIDETFAQTLRLHDFKVVALANWSKEKDIAINKGDNIHLLHHLTSDTEYNNKTALSFLKEGTDNMGLYQIWINDNISGITKETALDWIRDNWCPGDKYVNGKGRDSEFSNYQDLRILWNFNAAYNYDPGSTDNYDPEEDFGEVYATEWAQKNYDDFHSWLSATNATTKLSNIGPLSSDNGRFSFIGLPEGQTGNSAKRGSKGDGKTGIVLPSGDNSKNVIKFMIPASGTLFVKWASADSNEAGLKIERRNNIDDSTAKDVISSETTETKTVDSGEITLTGEAEHIWIYCDKGNAIIYEIEYVQGKYLYETNRSAAPLSDNQLIPMFGCQQYDKLQDYWRPGTLFNLSNYNRISSTNDYDSKEISLLRSVAKVELKIPKSLKSHHVYLRCSNRHSRYEPMDVSTPTDLIWADNSINGKHSEKCEWHKLIGHEPFYEPGGSDSDFTKYKQKLAWYYGSWNDGSGEIGGVTIPASNAYGNTPTVSPTDATNWDGYPHIINPRILRSDFAEFIYTGEADGIYHRYVMYVPEKFVDDPNNTGKIEDNPKVCHIEFRRGPNDDGKNGDPWSNVDDDNCYRIYFTKDGFYNYNNQGYPDFRKDANNVERNWENYYEQNTDILKQHWPIIRNHVYSFTVGDDDQVAIIVNLEVLPWKNVEEMNYTW
ncbi:MAG: hypothetical protein J1F12_04950 [Muribaculaceae bacterium]|nr:hypothetical protein [Muribaculaceae bacterium]